MSPNHLNSPRLRIEDASTSTQCHQGGYFASYVGLEQLFVVSAQWNKCGIAEHPHSSGNSGGGIPNPSLWIGVIREAMPKNAAGSRVPRQISLHKTWDTGTEIGAAIITGKGDFGFKVAISGDYAVVGAHGDNKAYVFRRTDTNSWDNGTEIGTAITTGGFGYSVGISGDYAVVGAGDFNDTNKAYVFRRTDTNTNTWDTGTEIGGAITTGYFGSSVAISGDYAVVGNTFLPTANNAYVFVKS
jgi:hypothetical protein